MARRVCEGGRCQSVGLATLAIALLLWRPTPSTHDTLSAGRQPAVVFVAGGQPSRGSHSSIAVAAAKRAARATKYRGAVNPKLRNLLGSKEYRQLIEVLSRLNDEGCLEDFLDKADRYWADINIFKLAMDERQTGGRGILMTIRRDWPRIWPESMDSERMGAFNAFSDFWQRLDRSRLMDTVMKNVLPDSSKDYNDMMESEDQKKLAAMTDDERRNEVLRRLGSSEIVKQYAILSQNDAEVQSIAPRMAPFVAKVVATLERKVATQTETLGKTLDYGLIALAVVVVVGALAYFGVIHLPSL